MLNRDIIEKAAMEYNGDKYSEEFYLYHLEILRNTHEINKSVIKAVKYLFLWKLGKVSSKQTPSSYLLEFSGSTDCQYYSSNITKANYEVIEKAIDTERLKNSILFRDEVMSFDIFKKYSREITYSTIVLPAFYIHIWRPDKYPIIDEKVWKVFCFEKGNSISLSTKPKSFIDFETYTSFFRKLMNETGLGWRTIDKGLWVIGNRLKESMRNQNKESPNIKPISLDHINKQTRKNNLIPIPPKLFNQACSSVCQKSDNIPFKFRGITITSDLIKVTMEILNAESNKMLPQNCRNDVKEKTPDGLDKRIKENLNTDLRTANIISDVLSKAGIVEILQVRSPQTNRVIKGTRLLKEWEW